MATEDQKTDTKRINFGYKNSRTESMVEKSNWVISKNKVPHLIKPGKFELKQGNRGNKDITAAARGGCKIHGTFDEKHILE